MEESHEDKYFSVIHEFRGYHFTPDMATIHIYADKRYNHIAIEVDEDEDPIGELIGQDELVELIGHVAVAVNHSTPSDGIRAWYEMEVNEMAATLIVESQEYLDYE